MAITLLQSADAEKQSKGQARFIELQNDLSVRVEATRALITTGVNRHENAESILKYARDLQAYPEARFQDRLLYLDFLHQLNDPEFSTALTSLEKAAATKPADIKALIFWMSQNNLNLLALDFTWTIPAELGTLLGNGRFRWRPQKLSAPRRLEKAGGDGARGELETVRIPSPRLPDAGIARQGNDAAAEREWTASVKSA